MCFQVNPFGQLEKINESGYFWALHTFPSNEIVKWKSDRVKRTRLIEFLLAKAGKRMTNKMKNKFWLWGQDAGSQHAASANKSWKLPGINKMDPAEGAKYLGINNICRVGMGGQPEPPFDTETEKLQFADKVVWSAIGDASSERNNNDASDLDEVLRQADKYPNVIGAVLDDFFYGGPRLSFEAIEDMLERLHNFHLRPLELWAVYYTRGLEDAVAKEYVKYFDVITIWNMWASAEFEKIDDDFLKAVEMSPGKRRVAGCYMWNYGEGKELSISEIKAQCEKYYEWIKRGDAEGIVFCANCCADLGLEAVEWVREWISEVGEEEI